MTIVSSGLWTGWLAVRPMLLVAGSTPDPEDVKAGWLGLGTFLLLAVAVAFLAFSLSKHLKKVDFEEQPDAGPDADRTEQSNPAEPHEPPDPAGPDRPANPS